LSQRKHVKPSKSFPPERSPCGCGSRRLRKVRKETQDTDIAVEGGLSTPSIHKWARRLGSSCGIASPDKKHPKNY